MPPNVYNLAVQIVRFVDAHQPGWVEADFTDAGGKRHALVDKVPIFTRALLDATSAYPHQGIVRCEVISRWRDDRGRDVARVTTERPDDVESTEGLCEFVVLSAQLSS